MQVHIFALVLLSPCLHAFRLQNNFKSVATDAAASKVTPEKSTGVMTRWNADKGYGFIKPDDGSRNVFCHFSALLGGKDSMRDGVHVKFEVVDSDKGKRADKVEVDSDQSGGDVPQPATGTGEIQTWLSDKGYGFIKPDSGGSDLFFRPDDNVRVKEGDKVTYEVAVDSKGRNKAVNVAVAAFVPPEPRPIGKPSKPPAWGDGRTGADVVGDGEGEDGGFKPVKPRPQPIRKPNGNKRPTTPQASGLTCDEGTGDFETDVVPADCQGGGLKFGIEGRNRVNEFGLRYCFNPQTKISWYVQQVLRRTQRRTKYSRKGIQFKTNARLSVCEQQAPSWYSCPHMKSGRERNTPNWCPLNSNGTVKHGDCISHPVQPSEICNKMVFGGGQCGCPKGKYSSRECHVDKDTCLRYSGYENKVCKGWEDDVDYDRGHLAASSDAYDDEEADEFCDKVDGKSPSKWGDVYDKGFVESEWHRGDYSKCAWTASFLMTNIVPQGSLLNQVCWADIEIALKKYSEGRRNVFVVIGNSKAGTMRGQRTPLEDGYDATSPDMVLIPKYMWKVACTYSGEAGASSGFDPQACTAWLTANRNLAVPEGCRTPMTLQQLHVLLDSLGELENGEIPGIPVAWDAQSATTGLLPGLQIKCSNGYHPEYCDSPVEWSTTSESDSLKSDGGKIQLTCERGAECTDFCRCCDDDLLGKLSAATAAPSFDMESETDAFPALGESIQEGPKPAAYVPQWPHAMVMPNDLGDLPGPNSGSAKASLFMCMMALMLIPMRSF